MIYDHSGLLYVQLDDTYSLVYFYSFICKDHVIQYKISTNINMHGLLETAGYLNTSYADPWWTESTLLQDTIGSHIKITSSFSKLYIGITKVTT